MATFGYYYSMDDSIHGRILRALFVALKPLAKALLRAGVGYREFADVAKAAFIHEASAEFGLRGRPTNVSRVAVLTGISRKEIKRIRDSNLASIFDYSMSISPAALVLESWHVDSGFLDEKGRPKILSYDIGPVSFMSLVKTRAGDIPVGAMKAELKRVGAIRELPDQRLEVLKRQFIPSGLDDRLVLGIEDVIAADISTLAHNCNPSRRGSLWFHQICSVDAFPAHQLTALEIEARSRLTEFASSFDDFLNQHRLNGSEKAPNDDSNEADQNIEAGVGLFYFERQAD